MPRRTALTSTHFRYRNDAATFPAVWEAGLPAITLRNGFMVVCSSEDYDLAADPSWRVWFLGDKPRAVKDVMAKGQSFRLHLHREIAFRMRPDLVKTPHRMSVRPANGDFLDVRRENLEIAVKPRKRGGVRRPAGYTTGTYRGTNRATGAPPPWSRPGAASAALLGDGADGARPRTEG